MKKYLLFISLISLMVCCSTKKPSVEEEAVVSIQFNADSAYAFCAAQCDFGPRVMNSDAHEKCGAWIQQKFQQYGYQVEMQKADLRKKNCTLSPFRMKRDARGWLAAGRVECGFYSPE
jgi:hypothetical protein